MNFKTQEQKHYSVGYVVKRLLLEHIKPYSSRLIVAMLFMVIVAACSAIIVKLVEPAIDKVFLNNDHKMLFLVPLGMTIIYSIKGIAEYYQSYLVKYISQRMLTDLQMKMYKHLLTTDLEFIQSQSSGRLISRFTNDISLMRGAVSVLVVGFAKHFLSIVFLIVVMFKLDPILSLIVFIAFPAAVLPVQQIGRRIRRIINQAQQELANYTSKLDETFQSIRIIKSFSAEQFEYDKAEQISNSIIHYYKKTAKYDALVSPIMELLSGISIGGIVLYGGILISKGETTPGVLFAFITAFIAAYRPFKSLLSLNIHFQEGIAAARRIFCILDIEPKIINRTDCYDINLSDCDLYLKAVSLKLKDSLILKNINLQINKNNITAIVGRSGSGKTSIANLLVRFYDINVGEIYINNHSIYNLSLNSLRNQIGLVTQDTILFDASIAENIAYGSNASREDIIKAAKLADADEFINNLSLGYDTLIGNQGNTLSGGQRQRIAIARAILKNSPIIILDEATSSLDPKSEQQILNVLKILKIQGKTIIFITHRLSSISFADNIIVLKQGEVIEHGVYNDLLDKKGEFYNLINQESINNYELQ